jgi:hypothetical protein
MTHHAPIVPGEPPGFAHDAQPNSCAQARRGDRWTHPKMAQFLRELSATHSVSAAARAVGMSRESAYRLRSRLKGGAFDLAWDVAFQHSYDNLAHAILDRAVNGVEVPVFYQGEQVGSYRRYDDRIGLALLRTSTVRGNVPMMGRHAPEAECHARRFEALLGEVAAGLGEARGIAGGAGEDPGPDPAGELAQLHAMTVNPADNEELFASLREIYGEGAGEDPGHGV